ncbi:MAG TPA: transglycosylase family protein [Acidimicrobiales bacterium]
MRRVLFAFLAILFSPLVLLLPSANAAVLKTPAPIVHKVNVVAVTPAPVPVVLSPEERQLLVLAASAGVSVATLRAEWQHVAVCEVAGNWSMTGSAYSGIGFLNSTWYQYGGTRYASFAGLATETEQIIIGMEITGGWVPDQNGCSPSGW